MNMKIQHNWVEKRLSELFTIETGTTPSTRSAEYWDGGTVNWITPTDLSHNEGKAYISGTERKVTRKALEENNLTMLPKKALILSTRAPVGYVAVLENEAVFNQGCKGLVPKTELSPEFYYYCLISKQKLLDNRSSGSTFKELAKDVLEKVELPFPPLPEQKKIVEILSAVDERIENTDQKIAKVEQLKKGLMSQLLMRGIGNQEFKNSTIGKIPKAWGVVKLCDEGIAEIRGNKTANGYATAAFIPMDFVPESGVYVKHEMRPKEEIKSHTYCERGDLLLAKITPSLENGKQGIVGDDVPNAFAFATTEVFPIHCVGIDVTFLFYVLKYPKFRNQIIGSMIGTTGRQRASKDSLERLEIPWPPVEEQKTIAKMLLAMDEKLDKEKMQKEKLLKTKKSLMNNLLSGKKRVKLP